MKNFALTALLLSLIVYSCSPATESAEDDVSIRKGTMVIAADESLQPIVDAQIEAYKTHYPEVNFIRKYVPEQRAINLILNDSAEVAVVTRELNQKEQEALESRQIKYQPARMALDAVTLIVNKNFPDSTITIEKLKSLFDSKSAGITLVFDNSSSSNLNFMIDRLKIADLQKGNLFAAKGNLSVFEHIEKNTDAIGIIGNNWISDLDDSKAIALKNRIKILKVSQKGGKFYGPTFKNLKDRNYPLERLIYMHTTEDRWGIAKGFIRFSCSQVGQLVVEKMGLLPFYIIPKEVVIDKTPLSEQLKKKQEY